MEKLFNSRQLKIFVHLCYNPDAYFNAKFFAKEHGVTIRTIQNDITTIKKEYGSCKNIFDIQTVVPQGTRLVVKDQELFESFMYDLKKDNEEYLTSKDNRISVLLNYILNQKSKISIDKCAKAVFVSNSTMHKNLKDLGEVAKKYSLTLKQNRGYVVIEGLERDKRRCVADNDINLTFTSVVKYNFDDTNYIKKILVDELVNKHYQITDVEFQNLISWVMVSVNRINKGFYIKDEEIINNDINIDKEFNISKNIFDKLAKKYCLEITDNEIIFLATYLNNHASIVDVKTISPEINSFISKAIELVQETFPSNFKNDVNFLLSLSLHCASLISRARNNMQIYNPMINYIKQNFSYAYGIATYFSYLLSERFKCKIIEDEIAFIAVLFNKSILDSNENKSKKKVCIFTNQKKSSCYLLEQLLYNKFSKLIVSITFISNTELEEADLSKYNVFLSTEENKAVDNGLAIKINHFPNEDDINKISGLLSGYENVDNIMYLFKKPLFFITDLIEKKEIESLLIDSAQEIYHVDGLREEIELRNQFGSTYFGNEIAILHPMKAISDTSFICTAILKEPIVWDEDKSKVKMVFLVSLQKNNLSSYQTWDYLSPIFFDKDFKSKLDTIKSFDDFYKCCYQALRRDK